LFVFFVFF
jgi:Ras-related protein Rab-32